MRSFNLCMLKLSVDFDTAMPVSMALIEFQGPTEVASMPCWLCLLENFVSISSETLWLLWSWFFFFLLNTQCFNQLYRIFTGDSFSLSTTLMLTFSFSRLLCSENLENYICTVTTLNELLHGHDEFSKSQEKLKTTISFAVLFWVWVDRTFAVLTTLLSTTSTCYC